jgi:hypothetical protein
VGEQTLPLPGDLNRAPDEHATTYPFRRSREYNPSRIASIQFGSVGRCQGFLLKRFPESSNQIEPRISDPFAP